MTNSTFYLGVIEGFYGQEWSWEFRRELIGQLTKINFSSYLYAPKSQGLLRKQWREPLTDDLSQQLSDLIAASKKHGVRFVVGLSPEGTQSSYTSVDKQRLIEKMQQLTALGCEHLAILFDDMQVNGDGLVERQSSVINTILDQCDLQSVQMCPTYYSDDSVLDELFGQRPSDYLSALGHYIPESVEIFWTGPKVISDEIPVSNIEAVAEQLRRKPLLWDNYWANDGRLTSPFIPIKPLSGRSEKLAIVCAGHCFNPMNQPAIAHLMMATVSDSYNENKASSLENQIDALSDKKLGELLRRDLPVLNEIGLNNLDDKKVEVLLSDYQPIESPLAQDVCDWLSQRYRFDPACLTG